MKTPREILIEKHQAATPKLDAIRQSAVAAVYDRRSFPSTTIAATILNNIWRELILPSRRIWAGLAAVWILILAVNFSLRDHSQTVMAKVPSPEMVSTFREQEELLTELIGPADPPVAEPQKPYVPRPSTRRFPDVVTA